MAQSSLQQILATLKKRYGKPKPPAAGRDPLALIAWEMVAYLADDATRDIAFRSLRERVGLSARALLDVPLPVLTEVCRIGGPVHPLERAKRIKIGAALAIEEFDGDLSQALGWDRAKAVKALCKFPSVAEPGAERILMLCGSHAVLGLDSNALRVLCRLGYGVESKNYSKSYRSGRDAAMAELPKKAAVMAEASQLLREHGKQTCKTSAPHCDECPVTSACAWYRTHTPKAKRPL
jgi:endonuclease-3